MVVISIAKNIFCDWLLTGQSAHEKSCCLQDEKKPWSIFCHVVVQVACCYYFGYWCFSRPSVESFCDQKMVLGKLIFFYMPYRTDGAEFGGVSVKACVLYCTLLDVMAVL